MLQKYFVTYYEEYPIYEPAEGGYYYAGRVARGAKSFFNLDRAIAYALEEVQAYDLTTKTNGPDEIKTLLSKSSTALVGAYHTRYIGEGQMIIIEKRLGEKTSGWHPYE